MQNDMEAVHRRILDRRRANRSLPPYRAALISEIQQLLAAFFARQWPGTVVSGVRRVGGGASKEQFFFTLTHAGEDRSEEHTSELQSLMRYSYAVFCLNKKQKT